jgi:hypothetical protein
MILAPNRISLLAWITGVIPKRFTEYLVKPHVVNKSNMFGDEK